MDSSDAPKKAHHKSKSGAKADKKLKHQLKKKGDDIESRRKRNPKAFAFNAPNKLARINQRNLDREQQRYHVPMATLTPLEEAPPFIVAVQGPPGVGKSTVIKSLVKHYTKQNLNDVKGPITVVTGKTRRITLIEVPNDLNSMIDTAKVADLVLILIDGSFGFEMETFEYIHVLQTHGFPKVIGVLTHLDKFTKMKALKTAKKTLKSRFWTEIYDGAKLFYLSGLKHDRYLKREVLNLAKFISLQKFRPLLWRNTHPYILVDRITDITNPEEIRKNKKCDRKVCFYGYIHGSNLKPSTPIHIPGCGDFNITSLNEIPDPCPKPEKTEKQRLGEKDKLIYAPMADLGVVSYDKDATFIELAHKPVYKKIGEGTDAIEVPEGGEGELMVRALHTKEKTIEDGLEETELQLFSDSKPLSYNEFNTDRKRRVVSFSDDENSEDDDSSSNESKESRNINDSDTDSDEENVEYDNEADSDKEMNNNFDDSEENEDSEQFASEIKWRKNIGSIALDNFNKQINLMKVVYEEKEEKSNAFNYTQKEDDDELFKLKSEKWRGSDAELNDVETTKIDNNAELELLDHEEIKEMIRNKFSKKKAETGEDSNDEFVDLEDVYGADDEIIDEEDSHELDDESEEEDSSNESGNEEDEDDIEESDIDDEDEDEEDDEDDEEDEEDEDDESNDGPIDYEARRKQLIEAKKEKKREFDVAYDQAKSSGLSVGDVMRGDVEMSVEEDSESVSDNEEEENENEKSGRPDERQPEINYYNEAKLKIDKQQEINRTAFLNENIETRRLLEGYKAGLYVRIEVDSIHCELVEHFDPRYPIVIGGHSGGEDNFGIVQTRIKKHRWHKKVLKNNDPIIVSMGWRRYQTMPIYSTEDHNGRNRMIKYTPQYMHCIASFYGPMTPPGTGFVAFQKMSNKNPEFRICLSGVVIELNRSFEIVKKLKLIGYPYKIDKNTAFVKDMFNSRLEVAKYSGASVQTVSGIRGQIKKVAKGLPGAFRATFEDKILLSDIVFLKTWYPITPKKICIPVTNLLLENKESWQGIKTVGEIRRENNIPVPYNKDSVYKPVERPEERKFRPLKIPKSLQEKLPFKTLPKLKEKLKTPTLETQRKRMRILDPEEKKRLLVLNQVGMLKNMSLEKKRKKMKEKFEKYKQTKTKDDAAVEKRRKEAKKRVWRMEGKANKKRKMT